MKRLEKFLKKLRKGDRRLLTSGLVLCGVSAAGGFLSPKDFFGAYLTGYVFMAGVAFGSLPLHMIHNLTGGRWGVPVKGVWEAALKTLPFVAGLFAIVVIGMGYIYPWTDSAFMKSNAHLAGKIPYLNVPFFLARAVFYFAVWIALSRKLLEWSKEREKTGDRRLVSKIQLASGLGIVVYSLTMTFASYDWLMSLDPLWFSTMFGPLFMAGTVLLTHAFSVACVWRFVRRKPLKEAVTVTALHHVGNLFLAFVMLWTYMAFSQYLIIWLGNLPEEIPWYIHRTQNGWEWVGRVIIVFHFVVPFVLLLMRAVKKNIQAVATVAALVIFMRYVDMLWTVLPEFQKGFAVPHWLYVTLPLGLALVWTAVFRTFYKGKEIIRHGEA